MREIDLYLNEKGSLPLTLGDIGKGDMRDPWGTRYNYVNFSITNDKFWRRDRNLRPINSTYDLWSNGPDRQTQIQVVAKKGRDDVIRARDGAFVGVAADF